MGAGSRRHRVVSAAATVCAQWSPSRCTSSQATTVLGQRRYLRAASLPEWRVSLIEAEAEAGTTGIDGSTLIFSMWAKECFPEVVRHIRRIGNFDVSAAPVLGKWSALSTLDGGLVAF